MVMVFVVVRVGASLRFFVHELWWRVSEQVEAGTNKGWSRPFPAKITRLLGFVGIWVLEISLMDFTRFIYLVSGKRRRRDTAWVTLQGAGSLTLCSIVCQVEL